MTPTPPPQPALLPLARTSLRPLRSLRPPPLLALSLWALSHEPPYLSDYLDAPAAPAPTVALHISAHSRQSPLTFAALRRRGRYGRRAAAHRRQRAVPAAADV
eukprot:6206332-Pleurochrysis_carterae.AAC.1